MFTQKCPISSEREGRRTSNSVHKRSTKTRISDKRRDLQSQRSRSRDASDRCWPISRERNVLETPKLVGRLSTRRAIMRTSFKVKGKGQGHQADIMLRPDVRHIFRTERPTNFKLGVQTEDEDPCRRDGPSPRGVTLV